MKRHSWNDTWKPTLGFEDAESAEVNGYPTIERVGPLQQIEGMQLKRTGQFIYFYSFKALSWS